MLLRLPPNSSIALSLALSYERYGGVPAWSHAQLSIVGYSDKWLWEQAALGTGGENICFDPLGTHTRSFITDLRPKLFDGVWKEYAMQGSNPGLAAPRQVCYSRLSLALGSNVGGGDFVQMFGSDGKLQYWKELDPQLHVSGPCLSRADYTAVTLDEAVSSHVTIRGSRTDDQVRVFVDIRLHAPRNTTFSRLLFFQLDSETYSTAATHERFVWGGNGAATTALPRTCSPTASYGRHLRKHLYGTDMPFRTAMDGEPDSDPGPDPDSP